MENEKPWTGKIKGEIELPQLDVSKYVGKKIKVAHVKCLEGAFGPYVKVETEPVDSEIKDRSGRVVKDKEGHPIVIRASRIFGLNQDAQGEWGWAKSTKLGLFMAKYHASDPADLVGVEVLVQQSEPNKNGQEFLTVT
jgi:hypothetical protein